MIYMLCTALAFTLLFYAGASPDVMQHSGTNWVRPDWLAASATEPASGHRGGHH